MKEPKGFIFFFFNFWFPLIGNVFWPTLTGLLRIHREVVPIAQNSHFCWAWKLGEVISSTFFILRGWLVITRLELTTYRF